jgi:hypothetical protein
MAVSNIFENATKSLPKQDSQIVRISMEQNEIAGRKDHLPAQNKSSILPIKHVTNEGNG